MSSCLLLFNNQSISQLTITNVENPRQPGPPANTEQTSVKSGVRGGSGFVPVAGCGVKRTMGWGRGEMMEMDGVRHGVKVESLEPPLSTLPFVLPGFSPLSLSLFSPRNRCFLFPYQGSLDGGEKWTTRPSLRKEPHNRKSRGNGTCQQPKAVRMVRTAKS